MNFALLAALLWIPTAQAAGEENAQPPAAVKTDETVKLADEAALGLFDRIRSAHSRALQNGKVVAANQQGSATK